MRIKFGGRNVLRYQFYVNQAEEVKVELALYADTGTKPWAVWELKLEVLRHHFYVNQPEEGKVEHSMEVHNKTFEWREMG